MDRDHRVPGRLPQSLSIHRAADCTAQRLHTDWSRGPSVRVHRTASKLSRRTPPIPPDTLIKPAEYSSTLTPSTSSCCHGNPLGVFVLFHNTEPTSVFVRTGSVRLTRHMTPPVTFHSPPTAPSCRLSVQSADATRARVCVSVSACVNQQHNCLLGLHSVTIHLYSGCVGKHSRKSTPGPTLSGNTSLSEPARQSSSLQMWPRGKFQAHQTLKQQQQQQHTEFPVIPADYTDWTRSAAVRHHLSILH